MLSSLKLIKITILSLVVFISTANLSLAQDKITLSITPPLFKLNIERGESWSSSIKVINNNNYDIIVYPTVVNFESNGEGGYGKFTPVLEEDKDNPDLLANWIELVQESAYVPREQSANIQFKISAPEGASPGGHYAAILVGTKSPSRSGGGAEVGVSSFITSLILVRIGGEVIERGIIREFSTDRSFYDKSEVSLDLRFENSGNVHIIPRGNITIYNMWGRERGKILINKDSDFGNVLPKSIRKFSYIWKGEDGGYDIGRYKAVVTLSFGGEEGQTVSKAVSFWIVPVGTTLKFASILVGFLLFMGLSIKAYVRRALRAYKDKSIEPGFDVDAEAFEITAEPLKEGIVNLRSLAGLGRNRDYPVIKQKRSLPEFFKQYKMAVVFCAVLVASVVFLSAYLIEVRSSSKNYIISSENDISSNSKYPRIKIVSGHDSVGELRIRKVLEKNGIKISYSEKSSEKTNTDRIIIRYLPQYKKEANLINQVLGRDNVIEEVLEQDIDIVITAAEDVHTE